MADDLNKENSLERAINDLMQQVNDLKRENMMTKAAANFLFSSIIEILDQQSGDDKFSEALKAKLNSEVSKITDGGAPMVKRAINEIMQPPVRVIFGNTKPEPFLK